MEPTQRPTFALAGAGATLIGFTSACVILGALIGWAAGSLPIGLLTGAVVGIPVGIFGVYRRYRDVF